MHQKAASVAGMSESSEDDFVAEMVSKRRKTTIEAKLKGQFKCTNMLLNMFV